MPHLIAVLAMLVLPTLAWGADLKILATASAEYDDNVYRVREGEPKKSDFVFRLTPNLALREQTQRFDYDLSWTVPFTMGIETYEFNAFDQFARGSFTYRLSDKTRISGSDRVQYVRSLSEADRYADDLTPLEISKQDERVTRNRASLGISHQFTSDLSGSLTLAHNFFDTTRIDRRQVQTVLASGNLSYAVDSKNRVGAGLSFTRQDFEDLPGRPGSETMIYRIFASWVYRLDETLSFTVRAGPTLFDNNQRSPDQELLVRNLVPWYIDPGTNAVRVSRIGSCPELDDGTRYIIGAACSLVQPADSAIIADIITLAGDGPYALSFSDGAPEPDSDQRVDVFANATLSKRWSPRLSSSIAYQRSESGASGLGGSAILDSVSVTSSWRATELWDVSVRADWTKRSSVFPSTQTYRVVEPWVDPDGPDHPELAWFVEGPGGLVSVEQEEEVDTRRWGVAAQLARKFSPHVHATLRLTYNRQTSARKTRGESSDFNNLLVNLGVQYQFDRIELW